MRSRYSAYTRHNEPYILSTWHESTRPDSLSLPVEQDSQWTRLKIIKAGHDTVEFMAYYKIQGKMYKLHERSRFVFVQDHWYYLDGKMDPQD
jgi:SEC-C motif-containing protein